MSPDDLNTRHFPSVKKERAGLHAYSVSCLCGFSAFVQGRAARDRARSQARDHVAWCLQNEAQRELALAGVTQ